MRYLFTIFHRLNSGGVRLNNQEIRNCIYTGPFNDALKLFDRENVDWQVVKSRIWGSVSRFRSVEILLRVLAFSERLSSYEGNLADFLNVYMHDHANASADMVAEMVSKLSDAVAVTRIALDDETSNKLSLAIVEAVLVATMQNRASLIGKTPSVIHSRFLAMKEKEAFAEGARYAVSSIENVRARLASAVSAFGAEP